MNVIRKLILKDHPDYDFKRYRFQPGDFVTTLDGAKICVKYSAIDYVCAYVMRRSLIYRELGEQNVYYKDLPYYKKGKFINKIPRLNTTLKWNVWDVVSGDYEDMKVLLYEELDNPQTFYGFVLSCENSYYIHTGIYIPNPYKDYIYCAN